MTRALKFKKEIYGTRGRPKIVKSLQPTRRTWKIWWLQQNAMFQIQKTHKTQNNAHFHTKNLPKPCSSVSCRLQYTAEVARQQSNRQVSPCTGHFPAGQRQRVDFDVSNRLPSLRVGLCLDFRWKMEKSRKMCFSKENRIFYCCSATIRANRAILSGHLDWSVYVWVWIVVSGQYRTDLRCYTEI